MGFIAWSTFRSNVEDAVFPEGQAENLVENHHRYVLTGIIDLQLKVECFQANRQDTIPHCATYYHCGATVFIAPRGYIHELYTVTTDDCCAKVKYRPTTKGHIDCLIAEQAACGEIEHPYQMYESSGTYYDYPDVGIACFDVPRGDVDKSCRATDGWFTLYRGEIWVYPHIDSNEKIMLIWDGIKREWTNTDVIDDDPDVRQAVEYYLAAMVALREDCDRDRYVIMKTEYDNKVADLMWNCAREQRIPRREPCFNNCG